MNDELKNRLMDLHVNATDWESDSEAIMQAILDRGYTIVENARSRLDEATPGNQAFRRGFNIRVAHPDLDELPRGDTVPQQHIDCGFGDDGTLTHFVLTPRG